MSFETGAVAWLVSKIVPTIAALIGGLTLFMFWTPDKIEQKGRVAAVFIAGAISTTAGFVFTGWVLYALGVPTNALDMLVGAGWALGFFSVAILNWVANWIEKRSSSDVIEVYKEIKKEI